MAVRRRHHIWQVDHLMGMAWTESAGCRTWTHLILAKKVLSHDLFFFFFEEGGNILTKSSTNGP